MSNHIKFISHLSRRKRKIASMRAYKKRAFSLILTLKNTDAEAFLIACDVAHVEYGHEPFFIIDAYRLFSRHLKPATARGSTDLQYWQYWDLENGAKFLEFILKCSELKALPVLRLLTDYIDLATIYTDHCSIVNGHMRSLFRTLVYRRKQLDRITKSQNVVEAGIRDLFEYAIDEPDFAGGYLERLYNIP